MYSEGTRSNPDNCLEHSVRCLNGFMINDQAHLRTRLPNSLAAAGTAININIKTAEVLDVIATNGCLNIHEDRSTRYFVPRLT